MEYSHSMRWVQGVKESIASTPQQMEYQTNMRGVDIVDQMRTDYIVQFHSHKWWYKHLFFIVDSWLNNLSVFLKHDRVICGKNTISYYIEVAHTLIGPWCDPSSTCKVNCLAYLTTMHYNSFWPLL